MSPSTAVVIPALNESATIGKVVATMQQSPSVGEVIVVDNCSEDQTASIAMSAGATVLHCGRRGMGAATKAGIAKASFAIIMRTDGDIRTPNANWVDTLTSFLNDDCWFCSGEYESDYDQFPLNTLVAKPALRAFFPELTGIRIPLSGTYAFRRELLDWHSLPDDSGFDIGMLLAAFRSGNRGIQRPIGLLCDRPRTIAEYAGMAEEVLAEILRHAALCGRLKAYEERLRKS